MKTERFIVKYAGTFYQMKCSDFRFNEGDYIHVSKIISKQKRSRSEFNSFMSTVVGTENGQSFEVFSDWSARQI
jgi:hypothetical protein